MVTHGVHLLVECLGCPAARLDDAAGLAALLKALAAAMGASVVGSGIHRFAPQGVTGFLLLEESHVSLHTWPERGYAALDLYTCGAGAPARALPVLREYLSPGEVQVLEVERGRIGEARVLRVIA